MAVGGLEHERYSETETKIEKKRRKWEQWLNEGRVSRRGKGSDGWEGLKPCKYPVKQREEGGFFSRKGFSLRSSDYSI